MNGDIMLVQEAIVTDKYLHKDVLDVVEIPQVQKDSVDHYMLIIVSETSVEQDVELPKTDHKDHKVKPVTLIGHRFASIVAM